MDYHHLLITRNYGRAINIMADLTGKKAPNFKLMSTSKKIVELKKVKSKYIVLFFYPKDDTPGCTLETKDFNSLINKFTKMNCIIFGISKDSLASHIKFKQKYKIKFDLLFCLINVSAKDFSSRVVPFSIKDFAAK